MINNNQSSCGFVIWKSFCFIVFVHILIIESIYCQNHCQSNFLQCHIYLLSDSIIYVDDNNTTGPWTGTPTHPFQNIPEGLAAADSVVTVYVLPGTYPIANDILVESDVMLFLDTCVIVKFNPTAGLEVNGSLIAFGARNDSIVFTSAQPAGTWKGIRFENAQKFQLQLMKTDSYTGRKTEKFDLQIVKNYFTSLFRFSNQKNSSLYKTGLLNDKIAQPVAKGNVFAQSTLI